MNTPGQRWKWGSAAGIGLLTLANAILIAALIRGESDVIAPFILAAVGAAAIYAVFSAAVKKPAQTARAARALLAATPLFLLTFLNIAVITGGVESDRSLVTFAALASAAVVVCATMIQIPLLRWSPVRALTPALSALLHAVISLVPSFALAAILDVGGGSRAPFGLSPLGTVPYLVFGSVLGWLLREPGPEAR